MIKSLLIRWWRELLIAILICAVGFLATRKDKIKTETVIEYKEKVVVKVEEKIKYVDKVQVKTRTIVKTKDGETRVQEETRTQERSVDTGVSREQAKEVNNTRKESVEQVHAPETYLLGGSWYPRDRTYNLGFHVRVFTNAPIYPGVVVKYQDGKFGIGLGVQIAL